MVDTPKHMMSPKELEEFRQKSELERLHRELEEAYMKKAQTPGLWAGRACAVLVVCLFLDVSGWITAFLSGRFYFVFATLLQAFETLSVLVLAGYAIYGSVQAYRQQEEKKLITQRFYESLESKN